MRSLQSDVEQRGARIFELVDKHPERFFSKAGFYQRLMALSMHDERFKTQLFRFVAVLPSLHRSSEIIQHLEEYFSDGNDGFHPLVSLGVRVARLVPWMSAAVLRWNVSETARQFIAGRNPHDVIATLRKRRAQKIGFTVDVLGEAVPGSKSVSQNLCSVFANESGRAGGCDRPSLQQVTAASSPCTGARRIYQLRYGELRAQKHYSRAVQNHFDRGGVQRLAACRDCHPSLFARFRTRLA